MSVCYGLFPLPACRGFCPGVPFDSVADIGVDGVEKVPAKLRVRLVRLIPNFRPSLPLFQFPSDAILKFNRLLQIIVLDGVDGPLFPTRLRQVVTSQWPTFLATFDSTKRILG